MKKTIKCRLDELETKDVKPPRVIHQSLDSEDLYYFLDVPDILMTEAEALEKVGDNCTPIWIVYEEDWRGTNE